MAVGFLHQTLLVWVLIIAITVKASKVGFCRPKQILSNGKNWEACSAVTDREQCTPAGNQNTKKQRMPKLNLKRKPKCEWVANDVPDPSSDRVFCFHQKESHTELDQKCLEAQNIAACNAVYLGFARLNRIKCMVRELKPGSLLGLNVGGDGFKQDDVSNEVSGSSEEHVEAANPVRVKSLGTSMKYPETHAEANEAAVKAANPVRVKSLGTSRNFPEAHVEANEAFLKSKSLSDDGSEGSSQRASVYPLFMLALLFACVAVWDL